MIPKHTVFIPSLHRDLTGGKDIIEVAGATVREVVKALDALYPGMEARLCDDGELNPHMAVSVDSEVSYRGLRQKLPEPSEIHFIPAVGGGANTVVR